MRKFLKGVLAGTLLGALAGSVFRPSRKPEMKDMMDFSEVQQLRKKTGKVLKGMARSVDKMMK